MAAEPKDHYQSRGTMETLLRNVPGFRGYLEKEYRRESDELQREWLADRLQRSKRGLDELTRRLADAARIDVLPQCDRLRAGLDKLISRIRGAMQGYSGFFDLVQVNEPLLDRVYEFDVALMTQVSDLADGIERLRDLEAEPDIEQSLAILEDQLHALQSTWDKREDILKGLE